MAEPLAITGAEIDAMIAASELAEIVTAGSPEYVAFAEYVRMSVEEAARIKEGALYEQYAAAITGNLSDEAYQTAAHLAKNKAREQAKTFAVGIAKTDLNTMGQTIANGLAEGLHPDEIATQLDMVKGLDPQRAARYQALVDSGASEASLEQSYQSLLADRRETIASYEARVATETAQLQRAESRGATAKVWMAVGDGRVCPVCLGNEADGAVPLKKNFPSGNAAPPAHPRCRCTTAYATSAAQRARMDRRGKARAKATQDAIDAEEEAARNADEEEAT